MAILQLNQLGERRRVAVHREDRVGDDQLARRARLGQQPFELVEITVPVTVQLGARQPRSIDDAGVVEAVEKDGRVAVAERGDRADVGQVAGADHERRLAALEGRDLLLQRGGRGIVSHHQAGGARTGSGGRAAGGGFDQRRVPGQAEVVVGGEVDETLAAAIRDRLGRLLGCLQAAFERLPLAPRPLAFQPAIPGRHRGSLPHRADRRAGVPAPARALPIPPRSRPRCRPCSRRFFRSGSHRRARARAPAPLRS